MLNHSLKNYFKCLVYVFVPLGCIFLGLLCGASILMKGLANQFVYLLAETERLLPDMEKDLDLLGTFFIQEMGSLSWSNPISTLNYMLDSDWISVKIQEFVGLSEDLAVTFVADMQPVVMQISVSLLGYLLGFFAFLILGGLLGYLMTAYFVRKNTVRRGFLQVLLGKLIDALLSVTLIAFTVWILSVWNPGAIISGIVSVFVFGFVSLLEAYCLHGRGKVPLKSVIRVSNCLLLVLSQFLIYVFTAVLIAIVYMISNVLVSVAVGIAVSEIAFLVIKVNAESYVAEFAKASQTNAHFLPRDDQNE